MATVDEPDLPDLKMKKKRKKQPSVALPSRLHPSPPSHSLSSHKRKKPSKVAIVAEYLSGQPDEILAHLSPLLSSADESPDLDPIANIRTFLSTLCGRLKQPSQLSHLRELDVSTEFNLHKPLPTFRPASNVTWNPPPPATPIEVTVHLHRFLWSYIQNFQRVSEALCRTAVDMMLNEALFCLKGMSNVYEYPDDTSQTRDRSYTLSKYHHLQVFAEFSIHFTHHETQRSYTGKVDYGIGLVPAGTSAGARHSRPYYSCLMVAEAKRDGEVDSARGQLLGYMACVRAQREFMKRRDLDVYGIATDGFCYEFVTIDQRGCVRVSERLDMRNPENIKKVLGTIVFILEKAFELMTPLPSPDGKTGLVEEQQPLVDPVLSVDETDYLRPPVEEEEE